MAPQPVGAYIRTQGIIAAAVNAALNPALARLLNPGMERVTLSAEHGILADAAVTSVALCLLVSLFASAGVRRDLKAGRIEGVVRASRETRALARLPRRAWALGAAIGIAAALVILPAIVCLFRLAGVDGIPFGRFALLKAAGTAALGYLATRWVILRHLLSETPAGLRRKRAPAGGGVAGRGRGWYTIR